MFRSREALDQPLVRQAGRAGRTGRLLTRGRGRRRGPNCRGGGKVVTSGFILRQDRGDGQADEGPAALRDCRATRDPAASLPRRSTEGADRGHRGVRSLSKAAPRYRPERDSGPISHSAPVDRSGGRDDSEAARRPPRGGSGVSNDPGRCRRPPRSGTAATTSSLRRQCAPGRSPFRLCDIGRPARPRVGRRPPVRRARPAGNGVNRSILGRPGVALTRGDDPVRHAPPRQSGRRTGGTASQSRTRATALRPVGLVPGRTPGLRRVILTYTVRGERRDAHTGEPGRIA